MTSWLVGYLSHGVTAAQDDVYKVLVRKVWAMSEAGAKAQLYGRKVVYVRKVAL